MKYHQSSIEPTLQNRPGKLIDEVIHARMKTTKKIVESVKGKSDNIFEVASSSTSSDNISVYLVDFGTDKRFVSCTCPDYRRSRSLCKHFFAVIEKKA